MSLDETVAVMRTMDEIRRQIGLVYDEEPGPEDGPRTVSLVWADDDADPPREVLFGEIGEVAGDPDHARLESMGLGHLALGGCLTFVPGGHQGAVLDAFGADRTAPMSFDEAFDAMTDTVGVLPVDGGVVAVELNGYQGSRREVVRRLGDSGRVASMYWNENVGDSLVLAEDGVVVATAELGLLEPDDALDLPPDVVPVVADALARGDGPVSAGLHAAAAWVGIDLLAAWFPDDVVVYPLLPPAEDFRPASPEHTTLGWSEPDLVARIVAAPEATQRAIAEWAALDRLRSAGLDADPAVAAVTAGFGTGVAPSFEPAAELHEIARRECAVLQRTDPSRHGDDMGPALRVALQRLSALDALRHACWPVGVEAALGALEHSVRGGPEEHRALREVRLLLDRG